MGSFPDVLGANPGPAIIIMQYFNPLTSLLIYIFSSVCLVILILVYSLQNPRPNSEKNMAYECGFKPFNFTHYPFDVQFYRVGSLFLLFDVEIMFFFPWVLNFYQINFYGHAAIFSFIVLLLVGFIYELKSGALAWYPQPWSIWIKPMTMKFRKHISIVFSNNFQQHQFHLVKLNLWPFLLAFSLCLCSTFAMLWLHEYNISLREVFNFLTSLQAAQFMMYSVGVGGTFYVFHTLGQQHQEKWKWVPRFLPTRDLRIFWQSGKYTNSLYRPYWGIASFMWLQWVLWNIGFFVFHQNMSAFIYSLFIGYIIHIIIFIWQNRIELRIRYTSDDESFNAYCRYALSFFGPYTLGAPWFLSIQFFLSPDIGVSTIAQEYPQFKQQDAFRMEHKAYAPSAQPNNFVNLDQVRMKVLHKNSVQWPSYNISWKWRAHQSFVYNNHLNPPISLLDLITDHKKSNHIPPAQRVLQSSVQRPATQPAWTNSPNAFVDMVNAQHHQNVNAARVIDYDADNVYSKYVGHDLSLKTLDEKVNKYLNFLETKEKSIGNLDSLIWTDQETWAAWGRYFDQHERVCLAYDKVSNDAYFKTKELEEEAQYKAIQSKIEKCSELNTRIQLKWSWFGFQRNWDSFTGYERHLFESRGTKF